MALCRLFFLVGATALPLALTGLASIAAFLVPFFVAAAFFSLAPSAILSTSSHDAFLSAPPLTSNTFDFTFASTAAPFFPFFAASTGLRA
eukprot:CAMPEP_0182541438 /NCGR_PEP_ID=MMETSP1323-20130603/28649_1 /TAXON_ID=236787 /ORGANISM="Florenciella parvula, Strain RCC1693" /LENGTH=89 /DNA_ID=CAMNT_0024752189 /DNA_START=200 /DNA_END=466 /DNA_ORIENTATION=-